MDNQTLNIKPKNGYGFIYCYVSPSGKKYIGQTKTTLKERAKLNAKGYMGCPYFYKAIQKYGFENFEVEILAEVPLDRLTETEIQIILDYDTCNRDKGYNVYTNACDYFQTFRAIPVYLYDANTGEYVGSFPSFAEAERQIGVLHGTIRRALNQSTRTAGGYRWRTEKFDKIEVFENEEIKSKPIYMYDAKTGTLLNGFSSTRAAAAATGYNKKTIQDHARGNIKTGKKHLFRYFKVDNLYDESSTTIPDGSNE